MDEYTPFENLDMVKNISPCALFWTPRHAALGATSSTGCGPTSP